MSNDYDSSHYPAGFDQEVGVMTAALLLTTAADALGTEFWRTTLSQRATLHRMVDFATAALQRPDGEAEDGTPTISMARHNDVQMALYSARRDAHVRAVLEGRRLAILAEGEH